MARMKFLCDAERCIECNACVTACKNEHEVPWGVNRRRVVTINDGEPGERSISVACMHFLMRLVQLCVQWIASTPQMTVSYCTIRTFVSVVVTAFMPVRLVRHNSPILAPLGRVEKWISAPSVQVGQKRICHRLGIASMVGIGWPKASYPCVRKCARQKLCWQAMVPRCRIYFGNELPGVELVLCSGVGVWPMTSLV